MTLTVSFGHFPSMMILTIVYTQESKNMGMAIVKNEAIEEYLNVDLGNYSTKV